MSSISLQIQAQAVPSAQENIAYITTFSKGAADTWGDDDHVQVYFFAAPINNKAPFYIRIFDPEIGGKCDQLNGVYNSSTKFSVYGGNGAYSNKDARGYNPTGKYKSGALLATKSFALDPVYDSAWYTFGPFNPEVGEFDKELNAHIFKLVIEGGDGDDGNMYKLFFSLDKNKNIPMEGGNSFAYEICFRLISKTAATSHLYPFIDNKIISVVQNNFDFDGDGTIRLTSIVKKSHEQLTSKDGDWQSSKTLITEAEQNTSLDLQFIKKSNKGNDISFYMINQYGDAVPFFSSPIGGTPKYKYKVDVVNQFDK
jgi:hypothetical protein